MEMAVVHAESHGLGFALSAWREPGRLRAKMKRAAAALLALAGGLFLLAPGGTHLGRLGLPTLANVYVVAQAIFWLVAMVFLARAARSPIPSARAVASA